MTGIQVKNKMKTAYTHTHTLIRNTYNLYLPRLRSKSYYSQITKTSAQEKLSNFTKLYIKSFYGSPGIAENLEDWYVLKYLASLKLQLKPF